MRERFARAWKLGLGMALSALFLFLAFREVQIQELWSALRGADYVWLVPVLLVNFASHYLRALRHRYLLLPIGRYRTFDLFGALMIGYMANALLPAHLGEFLRAYVIGRKRVATGSAALATIAVERVLDVLTLLILMALTFVIFPFPSWVRVSGYVTLLVTLLLAGGLALLRVRRDRMLPWLERRLQPISGKLAARIRHLLEEFARGLSPLQKRSHYVLVALLSPAIWAAYAAVIYLLFRAYGFGDVYGLGVRATLVTLVITTIAVVVPSSPGYVGTYHWLCMKSLELFGVPAGAALGYALVLHAMNMLPVAAVGVLFAWREGYSVSGIGRVPEKVSSAENRIAEGVAQ